MKSMQSRTLAVCAVIVTFHPSSQMIENMSDVIAQIDTLVVVDNGSAPDELSLLRAASLTQGFHLIENGQNLGIAEALNRGVQWAKYKGYSWIILFDQDSGITPGFINHMFAAWESHPQRERVAAIHPKYVNPVTGFEPTVIRAPDGGPITSMTSGALMPTWIFDKIGWFISEYFIDFVDWEFCFRIRAKGYLVADSRQAILLHAPGNPTTAKILGREVHLSNHSAFRRYYISRNSIVFYWRYLFVFPKWVLRGAYGQLKDTIICLIAENYKSHKLRNILLGTWDGLIGRMGPRKGL